MPYTCPTFLFTFFLCPEKVVACVCWFSFLCILHSMLSTVATVSFRVEIFESSLHTSQDMNREPNQND